MSPSWSLLGDKHLSALPLEEGTLFLGTDKKGGTNFAETHPGAESWPEPLRSQVPGFC